MVMKHLFKIFVLGLMVLVSGCGDWLEYKTSDRIERR